MQVFPVIHSTLSATHIGSFVEEAYEFSPATVCKLFRTGINHSYVVQDAAQTFIFRVYSYAWRSLVEISEEIRLLHLLRDQAIPVSYPVPDRMGKYVQELPAPEGTRYGVLFTFAAGKKVRDFSEKTSYTLGTLLGRLHNVTQHQQVQRVTYTPYTLAQLPYSLARVHFSASTEEMMFVKQAGDYIAAAFETIDRQAVRRGVVHLDIWYDNLHINGEVDITLFDFDFCGNGYLFYDVAYFIMQLYHTEPNKQVYQRKREAFFEGYQTVAVLTAEERKWLPLAGLAIWIFYLGVQSQRFDTWSNIFLSENYLKRYIGMAKEWLTYHNLEISTASSHS